MALIFGFYDWNGTFFIEFDSSRPNEHYSYALAEGRAVSVRREGQREIRYIRDSEYEADMRRAYESHA